MMETALIRLFHSIWEPGTSAEVPLARTVGRGTMLGSGEGDPATRIDSVALRGSRYEKAIQLIDPDREIV